MTFTLDLLAGLGTTAANAGIGTYRGDGSSYVDGETAITFSALPDQPDRAVCFTAYQTGNDQPDQSLSQIGVQVLTRGTSPADDMALRDQVYRAFQGLEHKQFGSVHVNQVLIRSGIGVGQDPAARWEYAQNFYADVSIDPTTPPPPGGMSAYAGAFFSGTTYSNA